MDEEEDDGIEVSEPAEKGREEGLEDTIEEGKRNDRSHPSPFLLRTTNKKCIRNCNT